MCTRRRSAIWPQRAHRDSSLVTIDSSSLAAASPSAALLPPCRIVDARRTLRAHEVPLHNRVRENPQPALVRVKAVRLVESRGRESRHVRPPDATPPTRSLRLGRPALPPLPPAAPPAPTEPSAEGRPVAPPPVPTPSVIGDPNLAQGDVSLAFFIVPVATVGSVAVAVAFFYAWRCWRDRKRRPVRPSALNIVGIEA